MVDRGADVNLADEYLNTPLHWATPFPAIIHLFVKRGAKLNAQNNTNQTALMWAVKDGHVDGVNLLLSLGAEVDLQDKYGFTALHAASLKGNIPMVKALLDHGASTTIEDEDGWTPLYSAAIEKQDQVIALLRDRTPGSTAIIDQVAAVCDDKNEHMMQRHIANKKSEGSTACTGLRWVVQFGQLDRIKAILKTGVNIDAADVGGSTALMLAAWLRQEKSVQLLLEYDADPNIRGRDGKTALHLAAEDTENQEALVYHLTQYKADVNASAYSFTPILLAAIQNHTSIVKLLIECGANVKAEDYHGRTALHYLAQHGNTPSVATLLSHGADVNASDRQGKTPLMLALDSRNPKMLRTLIKGGADVNITDNEGSTVLHLAADANEVRLVRELLDNGAMDDTCNLEGMTALHIALFHGSTKMVRALAG
jgi:ankyrin repeat protein